MKCLLVGSGKGGVGKTTIAVITAIALSKKYKVGLIDADISCPSIAKMLGIEGKKPEIDEESGKLLPYEYSENLKVFSIGQDAPEGQHIAWRGNRIAEMLMEIVAGVEWGEIQYLVFDLPPGTSDEVLTLIKLFKNTSTKMGGLVVTIPTKLSLADIQRMVSLLRYAQIPIVGIVENMSGKIFDSNFVREYCEKEGIKFITSIPLRKGIRMASEGKGNFQEIIEKYGFEKIVEAVEEW